MVRAWSSFLTSSLRVLISDLVSLISCWRSLTVISFLALVNLLKIFSRLTGGSECFGLVSFVSLTKVLWNWLKYWALTIGSSTFSIKVSKSSSYWLRTLTDLFLEQLSLHPILTSWRLLIPQDSGLLRNLNLTSWPKGWVVIPSLSVVNGYNRHMKGFPRITLSIIIWLRQRQFWSMCCLSTHGLLGFCI